ncbi:MAG: cellulose biosynthesis protein BcsS [Xanthobacteraceae bacterium]|jgi:hypothetical protein
MMVLCAAAAQAGSDGPNNPSFLLFAGTDLWRDGAFVDGGMLWSPAGLNTGGFTLKILLNGGLYTYPSGGLRMDVDGTLVSAAALPGWRTTRDGFTIDLYAGPVVQDYRLTPYDPGSRPRGLYGGAQVAGDVWYQPSPATMIALDGSIASIELIGSARAAIGWKVFEPFFVGPETQAFWCTDYRQLRLGAHVTGYRIDALEWSAAGGWAADSFGRGGLYLRLGVNARY